MSIKFQLSKCRSEDERDKLVKFSALELRSHTSFDGQVMSADKPMSTTEVEVAGRALEEKISKLAEQWGIPAIEFEPILVPNNIHPKHPWVRHGVYSTLADDGMNAYLGQMVQDDLLGIFYGETTDGTLPPVSAVDFEVVLGRLSEVIAKVRTAIETSGDVVIHRLVSLANTNLPPCKHVVLSEYTKMRASLGSYDVSVKTGYGWDHIPATANVKAIHFGRHQGHISSTPEMCMYVVTAVEQVDNGSGASSPFIQGLEILDAWLRSVPIEDRDKVILSLGVMSDAFESLVPSLNITADLEAGSDPTEPIVEVVSEVAEAKPKTAVKRPRTTTKSAAKKPKCNTTAPKKPSTPRKKLT